MNETPSELSEQDCISCQNMVPGSEPGTFACGRQALKFLPDCPLWERVKGSAS
jgi:hypothetical protein